jgi:Putative zinc-finger
MPSQDNENAMDGLLRRSLARDSAAAGDCPDAELLAAYFDQALGADEAARYEFHFSTCTRCREQLAAMVRANAGQQLHPADLALEPALAGARPVPAIALGAGRIPAQAKPAVSGARSEAKFPERKSPDARWLDLRWLIPVAAMLVLGTFVFMRFASHQSSAGLDSQVAMSKSAPPPQDQANSQFQNKAAESRALDKSAEISAESDTPSASAQPSGAQSRASSDVGNQSSPKPTQKQKEEPAAPGAPTASRNSGLGGSKSARAGYNAMPTGSKGAARPSTVGTIVTPRFPSEPAPAAPAPELNASLPPIVVATSSADAVKSPEPAPPQAAEQKSQAFGLGGRNLHSSTAVKPASKAKPAEEGYTETVISTADSDVFYRIAGGGFVEISDDGGATWQRQLLNPSAEFTAGSAPEPRICWLVGRSGIVFLTEDGKSWRKLPSPTSEDLVAVVARSASNATVTATDDRKWSTDDAGKTWHPVK